MRQFLSTLSQLLESGRATVTYDELAALTNGSRDAMIDLKILMPTQAATHVACTACHEDHIEEVVRIKVGGDVVFRLRCFEAGWVEVPTDRLRQWTLDTTHLAAALAAGIDPTGSVDAVVPDSVWQLGSVEIAGLVLGVVLARDTGLASLAKIASKVPPPQTVIVRTGDCPDLIEGYAATLALPSAFTFNSGRFEFDLDQVRRMLVTESAVVGNVFKRRGEVWQMSFEGVTKYFNDSVGIGYIARLLIQPNKIISAVTLLSARADLNPLVAAGTSGEILDAESVRQYRQRYNDLQEELEEAQQNNDVGRQEKAAKEMYELKAQLNGAVDHRGRSRQKTDTEKVRKAVSEAVSRDIKRITKEHPALGRHLTASISAGADFRYAPERNFDWLT